MLIVEPFLDICHISKKPPTWETPARKAGGSSHSLRLQSTQNNVDKLEREGQALRSDWKASPLADSLPQLLRTAGWYLDHKEARLHEISNHGESLTVSYLKVDC